MSLNLVMMNLEMAVKEHRSRLSYVLVLVIIRNFVIIGYIHRLCNVLKKNLFLLYLWRAQWKER